MRIHNMPMANILLNCFVVWYQIVKDIEATFQMWNLINIELIYFRSIFVCFKFFSVSNEAIFINISYVHHHIQLLLFTENTFFRFLKLYHCIRLYNKSNGLLLWVITFFSKLEPKPQLIKSMHNGTLKPTSSSWYHKICFFRIKGSFLFFL